MREKPQLPMWQVVTAISAVVLAVALWFKLGSLPGEASKEELSQLRSNQRKFSTATLQDTPQTAQR